MGLIVHEICERHLGDSFGAKCVDNINGSLVFRFAIDVNLDEWILSGGTCSRGVFVETFREEGKGTRVRIVIESLLRLARA